MCSSDLLSVPALTSVWLDKILFPEADLRTNYVSYEMEMDGVILSEGTVNFSYPKYFAYQDPGLTCEVDRDVITVKAQAYAKSVEIRNEADDLVLSDNFFDMNAGVRQIQILEGKADKLSLRSVYDIK